MPACFQLTRKGESEPANLIEVDAEMCKHFNVECDPVKYHYGWYDSIGLRLALGWPFEKISGEYGERIADTADQETVDYCVHMSKIISWLQENYTADSWHESK